MCGTPRRSDRGAASVVLPEQLAPSTWMRRRTDDYRSAVLRRLPLVVGALVLTGFGATAQPAPENRLDLVAFPGYAEAGGDDPRVNWVTPYVQQTGCKVHVRTVRSSTELLDAVANGR